MEITNKKIAVLGLGVEGKDLLKFLRDKNADITLFDQKPREELDLSEIEQWDIKFHCGENYLDYDFSQFDIIFRSPGIYRYKKELAKAQKLGVEISSNIKLFFSLSPARIIGVTGTKGKGTTSTLIYEILKADGKDVYLAGNIGKPALELLPNLTTDSWVVLELSSFQLIDMDQSPHIAVVLNITSDHMDWHKDINEYIEAKTQIVKHQRESDFAVINQEYEVPKFFASLTNAKVILSSKEKLDKRFKENLLLRGEHNLENIAAAVEVGKIVGVDEDIIANVVSNFKGLEHRLELVEEMNGVKYYNDSFSTGPHPAIAAVKSFSEPLTIILGGFDKGLEYEELAKVLSDRKQLTNVILIGELQEKINKALQEYNFTGQVVLLYKSPMKDIVAKAHEITPSGGVVVLSPAGASFDMFKDYKDRGNQFKSQVRALR